jgi:3-hydroxybutyryl-CoA dehydratase
MKKGDRFNIQFIVDNKIYQGFLDLFNDQNPMHTQQDFAIKHGFKSVVMHGNILNGFLSFFIGECLPVKEVMIVSQEINFKRPVYLNDILIFNTEIVDFFASVNIFEFNFNFENQKKEKVAKGKITIQRI